jgi:ferrous iron transport protein B
MVGTPNAGKTSLINALAGTRLQVGNWAGTTVEVETAEAELACGRVTLVDLPGAYTLSPTAADEEVVLPALASDPEALVVNVVDAGRLERDLTLTLELTELGRPLVVALNHLGAAAARGVAVDASALERELGVPVVAVGAHVAQGVGALVAAAGRAATSPRRVDYPLPIERAAEEATAEGASRWHALAFLTGEATLRQPALAGLAGVLSPLPPVPLSAPPSDPRAFDTRTFDTLVAVAGSRQRAAAVLARAVTRSVPRPSSIGPRLDRVLLHPLLGPLALVAGLGLTFHLTFALSTPWVDFLGTVQGVLAGWIAASTLPPLVASFLGGALVEGVGTVLAFAPVLFTLYALLGFMENAGLLARVAFLADGLMRLLGLPGRAVLPMVLALGCTVPAVQATKGLSHRAERLRVALALPSIPCGARLPVFLLLAVAFVPHAAALVVTALYLLGAAVAIGAALLFRRFLPDDGGSSAMELPPYRLPPARLVLGLAWARTRAFLAGAGGPILAAVVAVWLLLTLQLPSGTSVFEGVARGLSVLFAPLGLDDWRVVGALIPAAVAKEVVIGSLALTFTGDAPVEALGVAAGLAAMGGGLVDALHGTVAGLFTSPLAAEAPDGALAARLADALSPAAAVALMVFTLLYVPCVATLAAIRRAYGGRLALVSVGFQLSVAYLSAFVVHRLLS